MALPSYMKWLPAEAIETISRLEFLAHGTVEGFVSGKHKSARKGASVEFAEHRQYFPGDDLRNLDWKLVARRQRLYIKQYVDETNLRATIVLDASGSMGYRGERARGLTKLEYAKFMAASIAYLLVNQQDAAGFISFDTEPRVILPSRSQPAQVRRILGSLDEIAAGGETGLAESLHDVAERVPRRSVVFVLSDFYAETEEMLKALHHLRFRNHEVIAIQIVDPDERDFPFERLTCFEDFESDGRFDIDARAIRKDYIERFNAHLHALRRGCGEMRVTHELVTTDVPFDKALADILVRYRQTKV